MADSRKTFRLSGQTVILVSANLLLLITAVFLHSRISKVSEDNLKNLAMLNQVLPGFNNQTSEILKQDIDKLESQLAGFAYVFDPPQKEIKKDYDIPIYFVEELSKVRQSLKTKSGEKNVTYPDLGFKEALPDEKEAKYSLRQLYVIRDVLNKGMDGGINFTAVTPQPQEDLGIFPGIKLSKLRLEFTATPSALIDFLIQTSEIVPLDSVDRLLVKTQDSVLKADMILSHIVIEADWKDRTMTGTAINPKEIFSADEKSINSLRANSPFSMARAKEPAAAPAKAPAEQSKQSPRFLYQGKAVLKTKEVAVIEDTLNQETIFLAPGERTGDFMLTELKDLQITLKNINTGLDIVVKRQEQ